MTPARKNRLQVWVQAGQLRGGLVVHATNSSLLADP